MIFISWFIDYCPVRVSSLILPRGKSHIFDKCLWYSAQYRWNPYINCKGRMGDFLVLDNEKLCERINLDPFIKTKFY